MERLDLGHNRIETIPESIGRLQRLSELTLQNNSIVALSQEVTRLMLLKKIDVEHNPVAMSLSWHGVDPAGAVRIFRFMGGLIELDISDGRFENVNEVMLALPRLQKLNVSNNLIRAVLGTDGNHVRELDVSNNPGMTLIEWIHASLDSIKVNGLSALIHLRLENNQLQSIDVNHLTALTYLNLGDNQIQYIDLNRSTALVELLSLIHI